MNAGGYINSNRNVALAAIVFLAVGVCALAILHFAYGPTSFNRQVWLDGENAAQSNEAPRLRMADGLLESGELLGMSSEQIDAYLGPPTETQYFKPDYDYVYWLGEERGFIGIDSEWLVLKLDAGGTVSEARIVRD